jgi:hypothetical protein
MTAIMYLPLFILIFFGGALQVSGILSPTSTDMVVLVNIIVLLYYNIARSIIGTAYVKKLFSVYIATVLYLSIFSTYVFTDLLVYIYYLSAFFLSISYGYLLSQTVKVNLYKFTIRFLIFEVVITSLQTLYPDIVSSLSSYPIAPIDAIFGSFYVASDTGLCLFIIGLNVLNIYKDARFDKLLAIFALSYIVLSNANSKAFYILFLLLPIFYLIRNIKARSIYFVLAITVPILLPYIINIPYISEFYWEVTDSYDKLDVRDNSHRFIILAFIQYLDFTIFGDGLLTYYNPINKEWLFKAGFNTYLTILIDIGMAGAILIVISLVMLSSSVTKKNFAFGGYWSLCLAVYLLVGFIFSNVLITLIFSYTYFKLIAPPNADSHNISICSEKSLL